MQPDLIDALDRRFRLLEHSRRDGLVSFTFDTYEFRQYLDSDPRLQGAFRGLCAQGISRIEAYHKQEDEVVHRLIDARQRLVTQYPECDDSRLPDLGPNQFDSSRAQSLAAFDGMAPKAGMRLPRMPSDTKQPESRTSDMLNILRGKVIPMPNSDECDVCQRLISVFNEQETKIAAFKREWTVFSRSGVECACIRLALITTELTNPWGPTEELDPLLTRMRLVTAEYSTGTSKIDTKTFGDKYGLNLHSDDDGGSALAELYDIVLRAYEGVRAQLGTTRSYRALVDRFRLRAELYEADELRAQADAASPEKVLVARLARFLFDQGLNPLTEPLLGRLEPDLLDRTSRWTFYVEAKQYAGSSGRQTIVRGLRQLWDTLSPLQGYPYRVHEAFYVVFRRGGPRYVLPERLESEGVVVYPVLVDIAPGTESGSRQKKQPIRIDEADLLPTPSTTRRAGHRP